MDRKKVLEIPRRRVTPTVRIGRMGTNWGQVKTLNPMIVVSAERKIALPVVIADLTVAVRLTNGSKGSGSASLGLPLRISFLYPDQRASHTLDSKIHR